MKRNPRQKGLSKEEILSMPDEKWSDALVRGQNESLETLSGLMENGVSILKNTMCEILEFEVIVPDPWTVHTAYGTNAEFTVTKLSGAQTPGWRQHWDGTIELRGAVQYAVPPGTSQPFITFCTKMAPRVAIYVPGACYDTAYTATKTGTTILKIDTNGGISCVGNTDAIPAGALHCSLDGIRFSPADMTPQPMTCWPKLLRTKFTSPPLAVVILDAKNTKRSNYSVDQMPTTVDWDYLNTKHGPTIRIKNMEGLAPNNTFKVRLLVIGG